MAYEVTATRKRPQDFDRLVGQEFVVSTLENALKEGRIAHAYLFSGPRGVGKTSSARLLAKALNCEKGMSAHPCGECNSCKEIAAGTSVDVIEIDGASNTSVNDIRAIKEEVLFPPQASRYKIYIIDEVHMLSTSAFNALLKTIEEPPEYIIFIFATTELQKVPATIRSRCQQFKFQLISQDLIIKCLKSAAEDLNIKADEDALYWIAKESTGSMRDAYTLFDQVASFSSDHITLEKIRSRLNIAGFSKISEMVCYALSDNTEKALETLAELYDTGVAAEQIVKDSADFFRTLLLYKNGIRRPDLLGAPESDIPKDIVEALTKEQIEAALRSYINLYRDMRYTISPRFETELLLSRLSSLKNLASPETLIKKLEEMKNGIAEGKVVIKKKPTTVVLSQPTSNEEESKIVEKNEIKDTPEQSIDVKTTQEPEEDDDEEIQPQQEEISISLLGAIAEGLSEIGQPSLARNISLTEDIIDGQDGSVTFKMKSKLAFSIMKQNTAEVAKVLLSLTGQEKKIIFTLGQHQEDERQPDEKLKALQSILGGRINFIEENSTAKNIKEKNNELQSIRTSQADGFSRVPDEEYEGGDE